MSVPAADFDRRSTPRVDRDLQGASDAGAAIGTPLVRSCGWPAGWPPPRPSRCAVLEWMERARWPASRSRPSVARRWCCSRVRRPSSCRLRSAACRARWGADGPTPSAAGEARAVDASPMAEGGAAGTVPALPELNAAEGGVRRSSGGVDRVRRRSTRRCGGRSPTRWLAALGDHRGRSSTRSTGRPAHCRSISGRWCPAVLAARRRTFDAAIAALDAALVQPLCLDSAQIVLVVPAELHALPWAALPSLHGRSFTIAPLGSMVDRRSGRSSFAGRIGPRGRRSPAGRGRRRGALVAACHGRASGAVRRCGHRRTVSGAISEPMWCTSWPMAGFDTTIRCGRRSSWPTAS